MESANINSIRRQTIQHGDKLLKGNIYTLPFGYKVAIRMNCQKLPGNSCKYHMFHEYHQHFKRD